jgi:hypothetical protein
VGSVSRVLIFSLQIGLPLFLIILIISMTILRIIANTKVCKLTLFLGTWLCGEWFPKVICFLKKLCFWWYCSQILTVLPLSFQSVNAHMLAKSFSTGSNKSCSKEPCSWSKNSGPCSWSKKSEVSALSRIFVKGVN